MLFHRRIRQYYLLAVIFLAPAASQLAGFGDPSGFLSGETVTETPLYPGVVYFQATGSHLGDPQVTHVVTVDIAEPHLTMKTLLGERFVSASSGQFFRRSTVSQLHADNDALVAINTAFFDISSTMAPSGLLMKDRMMLREPDSRPTFIFPQSGVPAIEAFGVLRTLRYGAETRSYDGINRPTLSDGQINVYQQPWDRSPGTSANLTSGLQITEVLLEKTGFVPSPNPSTPAKMQGRVLQVRENQPSVAIPSNRFVITAAGSARAFLQQMEVNSTVEVDWRLTGGPAGLDWNSIAHTAPGNSVLVSNGIRQSQSGSRWDGSHPRSAIGISEDGSQLVMVMIEGRQSGRADGMSLHTLGQYFQHLGAHNALELDGGGSSSIVAQVNGDPVRLNIPSGGSERYVPAGLGVHIVPEPAHAFFKNIRVSSGGEDAILTWETEFPAISYAKFGQANLDRFSARQPRAAMSHVAVLSDLSAEGTYYARLVAEAGAGMARVSQIVTIPAKDDGEIIIDDPEAEFVGPAWSSGAFSTPWGESYRSTGIISGSPTHTGTYRPSIRISGLYDVYTWYTQGSNRPNDARYQIQHAGGIRNVTVDQTTQGERWRLLASNLRFNVGGEYFARITNQSNDAGKTVIADAKRWVLKAADSVPEGAVPAWWAAHFFGSNPPTPDDDVDGDSATIADEYLWGTDPTDSASRPRYRLEKAADDPWTMTFSPFHEGRAYGLQRRTSLTDGSWENAVAPAPVRLGNGEGQIAVPSQDNFDRAFFRLEVGRP